MLIKNLTKRERRIALLTLAVALAALIYNFIIEPIAARWKDLTGEIESKENALVKDSALLSRDRWLDSEYAKLSKSVKSDNAEDVEVSDILSYIENLSRSNSCLIINIKPLGVKNLGTHKEMLIDVTAEADISHFSKFLYDIENSKNVILRVRRFTISSKSSQPGLLKGTFFISRILID